MNLEVPKSTKGDVAHSIAKAGLSAIPIIGGPAVELFQQVVQPPLEKRRNEWMAQIGEKLKELETQGIKVSELQNNESFITAVMKASASALRTHKTEKLLALQNAILNIAKGQGGDETTQHLLFTFIDEFSEMHLRILAFAKEPKPKVLFSGALAIVLEENIPSLKDKRTLYDQLWKDLHHRGLVTLGNLHVTISNPGIVQSRTTKLGDDLLSFIANPL